jgi:hypothetical protein
LDFSYLVVSLAFMGLMNAFGMVSPVAAVHAWLNESLGISSDGWRLLLIFGVGNLLLPGLLLFAGSWSSSRFATTQKGSSLLTYVHRYAPAFAPMGFGIWLAHYGFHFAISGLSIIPVFQSFLLARGFSWLGTKPDWSLSYLLPPEWIFPLQVASVMLGFFVALFVLAKIAYRADIEPLDGLREMLPWALILLLMTIAALAVYNLPMEMRGSMMMGT